MPFEPHVQMADKKANSCLRIIREVESIATKVSLRKLVNMYKIMVRSKMYGKGLKKSGHLRRSEGKL